MPRFIGGYQSLVSRLEQMNPAPAPPPMFGSAGSKFSELSAFGQMQSTMGGGGGGMGDFDRELKMTTDQVRQFGQQLRETTAQLKELGKAVKGGGVGGVGQGGGGPGSGGWGAGGASSANAFGLSPGAMRMGVGMVAASGLGHMMDRATGIMERSRDASEANSVYARTGFGRGMEAAIQQTPLLGSAVNFVRSFDEQGMTRKYMAENRSSFNQMSIGTFAMQAQGDAYQEQYAEESSQREQLRQWRESMLSKSPTETAKQKIEDQFQERFSAIESMSAWKFGNIFNARTSELVNAQSSAELSGAISSPVRTTSIEAQMELMGKVGRRQRDDAVNAVRVQEGDRKTMHEPTGRELTDEQIRVYQVHTNRMMAQRAPLERQLSDIRFGMGQETEARGASADYQMRSAVARGGFERANVNYEMGKTQLELKHAAEERSLSKSEFEGRAGLREKEMDALKLRREMDIMAGSSAFSAATAGEVGRLVGGRSMSALDERAQGVLGKGGGGAAFDALKGGVLSDGPEGEGKSRGDKMREFQDAVKPFRFTPEEKGEPGWQQQRDMMAPEGSTPAWKREFEIKTRNTLTGGIFGEGGIPTDAVPKDEPDAGSMGSIDGAVRMIVDVLKKIEPKLGGAIVS